ncbi:PLC-like phosphodiesterase [Punctularia strigosozonata HHB-11173 SS5]|uniref:PLC-like phosphodiesterase n=1 Tax=Punctularia strigosozonata (strain HHB-11173) TaxID=741275 RepID=UPI0004416CB4|nr:PLC-like phosphodiesterase [Punctularia strigosozonata HHB-11173 SS5]EIN10494.1 PLC-like phosphodiesterase [Punctularia strigosozonata HHB-11173 SS5]
MSPMPSKLARALPECWGHRGASAAFPENTLASFEAAIRDGAEGIESDVHVSRDDVVVMFHDPTLQRTTNGTGIIRELDWYGPEGMEHLRTIKEPKQPIPTFAETVELLMKPENRHVKFNVDVKVQNDPERLFGLMHKIMSAQPDWENALAPRILIGLWHPRFIPHASKILPYCRRSYIGIDLQVARKYFWADCHAFSILFDHLTNSDGQKFIQECKEAGKQLCVWTVNEPDYMIEAVRWEVDAILTDVTKTWLDLRTKLAADYENGINQHSRLFLWTSYRFFTPFMTARLLLGRTSLQKMAGPYESVASVTPVTA